MESLSEQERELLDRHGFDELLFQNWCKGVREGWYSPENNHVKTPLLVPEPGTIKDLPRKDMPDRADLIRVGETSLASGELGVAILNGGMATRFGGVVKGVVPVLGERSFLGLRLEDVRNAQEKYGATIQVYLMNSFATDESTKQHLETHSYFGLSPDQVTCFTQYISLRMTPDGELFRDADGNVSPYGPGHGDFGPALKSSGCVDAFIKHGGCTLFCSNVDNLGARISPLVLGHHVFSGKEATVEVTPKWPGDVGGSVYSVDGKHQLIEQIRYPKDFDPEIVDVFNTNTFHFQAASMQQDFDLGWYYVNKKVSGEKAVQMERLIGELTKTLDCNFVRVKRAGAENRFLPVKTPDDLDSAREEIAELYE